MAQQHLRDKDLTCYYWDRGQCMFSERACAYAHHHTGSMGDKHRSKAARGMQFGSLPTMTVTTTTTHADDAAAHPATTAAGRKLRDANLASGQAAFYGAPEPSESGASSVVHEGSEHHPYHRRFSPFQDGGGGGGGGFAGPEMGRGGSPAPLQSRGNVPTGPRGHFPPAHGSFAPHGNVPPPHENLPPPPHGDYSNPPPGITPSHSRASSSTLPGGVQPVAHSEEIPARKAQAVGQQYHQRHATGAWSADWNGPVHPGNGPHVRRMSNLNPNAQAFQASPFMGAASPRHEPPPNFGPPSMYPTVSPPSIPRNPPPPRRRENALGIDGDDFAMESLDRKGKGRTLSNLSGPRPSFAMQGPPTTWAFEERANRYTAAIQREIDTRPPRSIEMPNLFWRLGIRLPSTVQLPPLPPQIEELWVRRDTISRNLKGAETWMRLFNEDIFHMRLSNDPQAAAYARWGEQYLEQMIGVDIPRWTLEIRATEEAMIGVMKGLQ